ncbi:MAG: pilus assembly protein PilY [Hydrogenophaga sp.]|uniref:pilus assembly protein n=1 Tax=Hydrogenophaga sp. TaxID=1904254 RepID=UPI0025BE1501|nr:PilC/PilY family type IV pilus protein [Hydrogenophaga sp.]MBT9553740.1 pilus assembly protein PilY [Hydrogenophaga sp.]
MKTFDRRSLPRALGAMLMAVVMPLQAQYSSDIDIYGTAGSSQKVDVLIMIDNTANWTSAFNNEIAALRSAFNGMPTGKLRVGMMLFTESGGGNSGADGGYVRAAIRDLDDTYKSQLSNLLGSFDVNLDKSNGGKTGIALAEAYHYLAGKAPYSGNNKDKTDYVGNNSGTAASNAIYSLTGNALTSKSGSPYRPPSANTCNRTFVIYLSNGAAQENTSDTTIASNLLTAAYSAAGMTRPTQEVQIGTSSNSDPSQADEWARFLSESSLGAAVFTIDVDPVRTGQGPTWSALLRSMAAASGGNYYAVTSGNGGQDIAQALLNIVNSFQQTPGNFISAALPTSLTSPGRSENQVYLGVFRPDDKGNPRWRGNLRQYKIGYNSTTKSVFLSDAENKAALDAGTGFFAANAVSYWTQSSEFWINQKLGQPPSASDSPDGAVVEKGGAAQRLRIDHSTSQSGRNVLTCVACADNTTLGSASATQFDTSNNRVTASALGVASTEANNLINWIRGTDNAGDEAGPGSGVTIRPSVHGDILHSGPAVINYGGTTGVVVYYGANDGMLHAVNGNVSANVGSTPPGSELWGFVPEELFPKLKRLRNNAPEVRLSTTEVVETASETLKPSSRDYFVDGPIGVYQKVVGDVTTQAILYVAMRRGGRFLYAIDVSTPGTPKMLWRRRHTDTGFSFLGQTWSKPKVARIKGNTNPVLVFGAGYDAAAEDVEPPVTTTMGNAVVVLDAFTGELLRKFDTTRSVPADVALVDSDADGKIDRAYAADVGGSVYRIDFEITTSTGRSNDKDAWTIATLASLSETGNRRKFFFAPDVTALKTFTAVLIGSGDREKPLDDSTGDAFFTVFDRRGLAVPAGSDSTFSTTDLGEVGTSQSTINGCWLGLSTNGEKVVNAAATTAGITYFGTNQPKPADTLSCKPNLGTARLYQIPAFCGVATTTILPNGGLPPSPVITTVILTETKTNPDGSTTENEITKPIIIGGPEGPNAPSIVPNAVPPNRKRSYWYLEGTR